MCVNITCFYLVRINSGEKGRKKARAHIRTHVRTYVRTYTHTLVRFGAARLEKKKKKKVRRLKKQIGKSTERAGVRARVYRARSMCGAYPFPGDLRAKFAWKEANRLSRGELIDNTAVTCSSLDRRPAALPLFLSASPSPSLPPFHPSLYAAVPSNPEKFTLSVSIGAQYRAVRSYNTGFAPNFEIPCIACA